MTVATDKSLGSRSEEISGLCEKHAHLMGLKYTVERDSTFEAYLVTVQFHETVQADFLIWDEDDVPTFLKRFQIAVNKMLLWLLNKTRGASN